MAIKKWRPAKAGDSGLMARFRNAETANWKFGAISGMVFHENGNLFENSSGWFLHCEVLEAYLSDDEVDRLAELTEQAIVKASMKNAANIAASIRQHFASEKGGE